MIRTIDLTNLRSDLTKFALETLALARLEPTEDRIAQAEDAVSALPWSPEKVRAFSALNRAMVDAGNRQWKIAEKRVVIALDEILRLCV